MATGDSVLLAMAPANLDRASSDNAEQTDEPAAPKSTKAPIVISPGGDGITIASDDLEALDRFEALLRSLSKRMSGRRQFRILTLKSADALNVAETLQNVFLSGALGSRGGGVTIVPDTRLNALIVQGSSTDMEMIEDLLEVLDTKDLPESAFASRPKLIPVIHTRAQRIILVLEEVYRRQLTTGGSRRQLQIPRGASKEIVAMLQQLNQAASGPEMTLSVDETANAIVVLASPPLTAEVEQLTNTLDTAANDSSRTVKVVQLKKTNTKAVQQALELLIREPNRRSRRRRSK